MGATLEIVLADDQGVVVDALAALLTQGGYRVVGTADNQAELLRQVRELQPDLCVLGNRFPDGAGVDALPALFEASPRTKIVMLTGQRDAETMRRALDAGAAGYVHKSREARVLLDALRRVSDGELVVEGSFSRASGAAAEEPQLFRLAGYLTQREYECLAMLAEGLATDAMACRLGVSRATVRTHVQAVLTKLGVHSRLEAASVATRYGLVHGPTVRRRHFRGERPAW